MALRFWQGNLHKAAHGIANRGQEGWKARWMRRRARRQGSRPSILNERSGGQRGGACRLLPGIRPRHPRRMRRWKRLRPIAAAQNSASMISWSSRPRCSAPGEHAARNHACRAGGGGRDDYAHARAALEHRHGASDRHRLDVSHECAREPARSIQCDLAGLAADEAAKGGAGVADGGSWSLRA